MTSGNRSDEPIATTTTSGHRLAGIADLFLMHNRPIHVRCDDSVTRVVDGRRIAIPPFARLCARADPVADGLPRSDLRSAAN